MKEYLISKIQVVLGMGFWGLVGLMALVAIIILSLHFWSRKFSGGTLRPSAPGSGQDSRRAAEADGFGVTVLAVIFLLLRVFGIPLAILAAIIWWSGIFEPGLTFDQWDRRNGGWQELSDLKSGRYVLKATGKNLILVAEREGGTRKLEVLPDGTIVELGRPGTYPEPGQLPSPGSPPLGLIFKVGRDGQPFPYVEGVKVAIPGGKKLWVTINVPQDRNPNFCFNKGRVLITGEKI